MNQRIKELAEEAELNTTLLFNKDKLEKFAELLIKECSKAIFERNARSEPAAHIYLLKHFNIEQ